MAAQYPDGWFNSFDMQAYRSMTRDVPNKGRMVEIGTYKGRSLSSVAKLIVEKDLKVLAVEPFLPFVQNELAELQNDRRLTKTLTRLGFDVGPIPEATVANIEVDTEEILRNTLKEFGLKGHVRLVKKTSVEAARLVPDGSLDFVFIDGDHSDDAVTTDVYTWWPKLKPTGFMGGHDYIKTGGTVLLQEMRMALETMFGPEGLNKEHHRRSTCWQATRPPKLIEQLG